MSRTIILDAAHGSNTAGKCSPDGKHKEYIWSRDILAKVKEGLLNNGVCVVETVTTNFEIGLLQRKSIMNAVAAPAFVFSLHNNAAKCGEWANARNASIWTTKGKTQSDQFATYIYEGLVKDVPEMQWRKDTYTDNDIDYEENFTVLISIHPSALLEWGFQDNKEDLKLIEDPLIKEKLCICLIKLLTDISKM